MKIKYLLLIVILSFPSISNAFTFDIWKSGDDIDTIISKARQNNIPLHRSGLISKNKKFNPKMCVPYRKTATRYFYKANLLGEWATVTLFLTQKSKRLSSIDIDWSGPKKNRESGFPKTVMKALSENNKRSTRMRVNKYQFSANYKLDKNNEIHLSSSTNGTLLYYTDRTMSRIDNKEKRNVKKKNTETGLMKDKNKF